jgi:DNA modification methylase
VSDSGPRLYHEAGGVLLYHGDCLDWLPTLPAESVDSAVTDPPYHLTSVVQRFGASGAAPAKGGSDGRYARRSAGFMGQQWDGGDIAFRPETWRAVLRVLKPGGHLLAFGSSRTYHRLACAIEDAGFEIRDCLTWLYGSGFPKSHDVAKGIDKLAGVEREVVGSVDARSAYDGATRNGNAARESWRALEGRDDAAFPQRRPLTSPATDAARRWDGWGTALKPAAELIVLARKPLAEGTVAANVVKHGTGAINIGACRLPTEENRGRTRGTFPHSDDAWGNGHLARTESHPAGRWPANVVLDEEAAALLDAQSGERVSGASVTGSESSRPCPNGIYGERGRVPGHAYRDTGGASRFFPVFTADGQDDTRFRYVPKASRRERGEGNDHPTVKSLALIRWLTRLITPPGGLVCDPFAGSGTGALAARLEGFRWTGCELLEKHCAIAVRRLERTPVALPLEPEAVTP